jgi:hypothetical protein
LPLPTSTKRDGWRRLTGEQARLELLHAVDQRAFEIERADQPVLGGAERQIDRRHRGQAFAAPLGGKFGTERAGAGIGGRIAMIGAIRHHPHRRQKPGERANGGGFPGAAVAHDEHAPDAGIDRSQQQAELHFRLPDQGAERIDPPRPRRGLCRRP